MEFFRQFRGGAPEPAKRKEGQPWPFKRGLLHCNLLMILDCPPVFDATVNTAVVVLRNEPEKPGQEFTFIGASRLDQVLQRLHNIGGETLDLLVQEKLGALVEGFEGAEEFAADGRQVLRVVRGGIPVYRAPLSLYHDCVFQGVFEPSPPMVAFYDKHMRRWVEVVEMEFEVGERERLTLWEMVRTSESAQEHSGELEVRRADLASGDLTILGAVTEGGVGLQTSDNGRFLAYLEGTPEAKALLAKNEGLEPDGTGTYPNSDWGRTGVRRIIRRQQVASAECLNAEHHRSGIPEPEAHWVPYQKGDAEGNRWTRINNCYIDWSEPTVAWLFDHSGNGAGFPVVRNSQLYFVRGFCWNHRLTNLVKAQVFESALPDQKCLVMRSVHDLTDELAAVALLNSSLLSYVIRQFFISPQCYGINDARLTPWVIPSEDWTGRAVSQVERAVGVQRERLAIWTRAELADEDPEGDPEYRRLGKELEGIEEAIDGLIAELYGLPVPEDPVEELVRLAAGEAEGEAA